MEDWFQASTEAFLRAGAAGSDRLTYAGLEKTSAGLAAQLRSCGVRAGAVVAAVLPNCGDFLVTLAATWRLDAVFAPLSTQLTAVELGRIIEVARPAAIVRLAGVSAGPLPARGGDLSPSADDALLLFTSGSTGDPKGVLLSSDAVRRGTAAVVDSFGLTPDDRTLALLPWTHGHGLIGVVLATARSGGSLIVDGAPGMAAIASGQLNRATWLSVVPPSLAMLCEREASIASGGRPRFIRTASAPLPLALARRAESIFDCPIAEAYGMTETSHQAAANPPHAGRVLGTVGVPTGVEFRTVGEALGGGHELEVRGPALFRGYLRRPDLSAEALVADGWYRTRDIGQIGPEGHIRLLARSTEIINRGGFKVSPVEVEESLSSHPGVSATVVASVPHAVLGEEIGALVVVRSGSLTTVGDLQRHCRQYLAAYKQPGVIRFVDEIPRLPNGKPSRRLASQVLQASG